jgi:hypothetical protein
MELFNYCRLIIFETGHVSRGVFVRSEAEIVGSNPTQGMDVWCLCVYVRFSVFVYR